MLEHEQYPRGIVSDDGHSLEFRHCQVGGFVHFNRCGGGDCLGGDDGHN